ncbi:MAG: hypothetical protein M3R05_05720 [Chloroflexota bacterium]|nr:hypothetical protein [Chloroflexota bacterium]
MRIRTTRTPAQNLRLGADLRVDLRGPRTTPTSRHAGGRVAIAAIQEYVRPALGMDEVVVPL